MEMEELERKLSAAGADYRNIPVPKNMEEKLNKSLRSRQRIWIRDSKAQGLLGSWKRQ